MYTKTTRLEDINLHALLNIARQAGEAIMAVYHQAFDVIKKEDGSPLTIADQRSNEIITSYLLKNYSIPILSEENEDIPYEIRKNWKQFWCIDPLDGTKEFIHKRREFTVNIALVEDGKPILGVIYSPVFQDMFYAIKGMGSFCQYRHSTTQIWSHSYIHFNEKRIQNDRKKHLKVILSRSHNDGFDMKHYLSKDESYQVIAMGSSLKFCRIAQGIVDINIRMKPTSEWDTAAGQIILEESGKKLVRYEDGLPLVYNKPNILNPYFIAY